MRKNFNFFQLKCKPIITIFNCRLKLIIIITNKIKSKIEILVITYFIKPNKRSIWLNAHQKT